MPPEIEVVINIKHGNTYTNHILKTEDETHEDFMARAEILYEYILGRAELGRGSLGKPRKVWLLTVANHNALNAAFTEVVGIYETEARGLAGFSQWLRDHMSGGDEPAPPLDGCTRDGLDKIARNYFDSFPEREGPESWALDELTMNKTALPNT